MEQSSPQLGLTAGGQCPQPPHSGCLSRPPFPWPCPRASVYTHTPGLGGGSCPDSPPPPPICSLPAPGRRAGRGDLGAGGTHILTPPAMTSLPPSPRLPPCLEKPLPPGLGSSGSGQDRGRAEPPVPAPWPAWGARSCCCFAARVRGWGPGSRGLGCPGVGGSEPRVPQEDPGVRIGTAPPAAQG